MKKQSIKKDFDLDQYKTEKNPLDKIVVKTFCITRRQEIFLESEKINRSELVRDFIQSLMDKKKSA